MKVEFRISEDSVILLFKKVVTKWEMVFIYHQKVKCDVINKKLNKKA